jgi:hypothetical protein
VTMSSAKAQPITIFEGPDGGGKSTLAQEYAACTNALYIHHGPYKQVTDGLARMFAESMLPALMGYQPVVLDRCWISEPIYADAFRQGDDRVKMERARVLERLALRGGAVLVKCLPPWAFVKNTFNSRKAEEYLDDDKQLLEVYGDYQSFEATDLHVVEHDYTKHLGRAPGLVVNDLRGHVEYQRSKNPCHPIKVNTAGNWDAPIVIVGEDFAEHKNGDPMYQWPFGSLSNKGCSLWLSQVLYTAGISEQSLLWINADELRRHPEFLDWHGGKRFVSLGDKASRTLEDWNQSHVQCPHPQYHKRFKSGLEYPLIGAIKEALHDHAQ